MIITPVGFMRSARTGVESEWCVSFDGSDDWVNCGTSLSPLTGNYTVAFWVKTSVASGQRCVIAQAEASSANTFAITIGYGGGGKVNVWNDASGTTRNSTTSVADGNWHHVAVTRSGSTGNWTIAIYIDGALDSNGVLTTNPFTSGTKTLAVGQFGAFAGYRFSGQVDDVRLWNGVVLGSTDITAIYNNTSNVTTGLTFHLPMEEGTGTTTVDSVGGVTCTLTNGPTWHPQTPPKLVSGRETLARSLSFDGVDDYVEVPSVQGTFSSLSIDGWIYRSSNSRIASIGWSDYSGLRCQLLVYGTTIFCVVEDGSLSYKQGACSSIGWFHVAMTFSPTLRCFIDGLEIPLSGAFTAASYTAYGTFKIGYSKDHGAYLNGKCCGVRLFSRDLSSTDIQKLARGQNPATNDPVGWWKGDETSGTLVADYGSGGHDGTCVGGVGRSTDVPPWLVA